MSILSPLAEAAAIPLEEKLYVSKKKKALHIGILKEDFSVEKRVCLSPDAVGMLVNAGHRVKVESQAGDGANFTDVEYSEAGAEIVFSKEEVMKCPLILKVAPPTIQEIDLMRPKSTLISALQIKLQSKEWLQKLAKKKITALAFELIQDKTDAYPFLNSLSEIAGIASIHIANEWMSNYHQGKGLLLGNITGVPSTEIVVLGAGTVGEYACKTALAMGIYPKVFDNSIHRLKRLQKNLGVTLTTSTIQEKPLTKALRRCDVLIAAVNGENRAQMIVSEEMVQKMKKGAVIIDVAIDNGGCVETSEVTSHQKPVIEKYGVLHYGVPNISSRYARTASMAISNLLSPFVLNIAENGGLEDYLQHDYYFRTGVYLYHGILVNAIVGKWFDTDSKDLNLFFIQ